MRYLLDTHTFIWLDNDPGQLSVQVTTICADGTNILFLSLVSLWEMQIKINLGKMSFPLPLKDMVEHHVKTNRLSLLPVEPAHIYDLSNLPDHHRDPFDRLLIAQARSENLTLLSADSDVAKYPVTVLW